MKLWFKRAYKVIASAFAFFINTFGLVLSIVGVLQPTGNAPSEKFILFLLILTELFLIFAVIYTIVSVLKNYYDKASVEKKNAELMQFKEANKTFFENQKNMITCYKDFSDRLNILEEKHKKELHNLNGLREQVTKDKDQEIQTFIEKTSENLFNNLEDSLTELYKRFMITILNYLRDNIEEYLFTKGCKTSVSLAIKQLKHPSYYSNIKNETNNIYTAFRDTKTYNSKKRTETWDKQFCIKKNSDFILSIEKDYYIFNYMNKTFVDNGLYLNENSNFYENYNSGVTCTIYSCVNEERFLYGFLACDSLLEENTKIKYGNIYDYNIANMMMSTAHIIALFLDSFLEIWDKYYVQYGYNKDDNTSVYNKYKNDRNICNIMTKRINKKRYNG